MSGTELFVYGTLRHDQPEHRRYCRGVTGWRPARVRGRLHRLPEGYLLLVVPRGSILMEATQDAGDDERRRELIGQATIDHAAANSAATDAWILGEVLTFSDAIAAWPPLDGWEGVRPGSPGVYARVVEPVQLTGESSTYIASWIYASIDAPPGSAVVETAPVA